MNALVDSVEFDHTESMEIEETGAQTLKDKLTVDAHDKYVKMLQNPQWEVYTRPDALYSRLGLQLEAYPLSRSTPSAYQHLLDQVSSHLISFLCKNE